MRRKYYQREDVVLYTLHQYSRVITIKTTSAVVVDVLARSYRHSVSHIALGNWRHSKELCVRFDSQGDKDDKWFPH